MDLLKTGRLIAKLRKEANMTQKSVADKLGICAKTVSKWETGHGFPDVSLIAELSKLFGVDVSKLIEGELPQTKPDIGNIKRTKFYVCPKCGTILTNMAKAEIICCGRTLSPLVAKTPDADHSVCIQKIEDESYITFAHEMTKSHYISFVSYVRFDRVLTVKLYPEQDGEVRIPQMRGGKLYYYCSEHGLFEYKD